ncbi:acyltransferase family protein [Gymnodinialimonas sp.]
MEYRREIDGLRTLAVVPVVIYHLKIPLGDGYVLPGGFLGVDVFFVLSGFLITKIILEEMTRTGRFSLSNFYIRRARRILPALFLVIFASVIAGIFILTPTEMARLTESAMAALLFVSNGYWFFELESYGAPVGLLQPLLHTWSLAIEEQFYLVFPLVLLLIKPSRWPVMAAVVLVVLLIASLVAAERTTAFLQPMSFYSPLSRAWEMLAGALLALALTHFPQRASPPPILRMVLPKLGVAVLVISMVVIDLDAVAHPGLVTAPVVLATVAILWSAGGLEVTTRVLSTGPFVFIGRLSYSLYLWHFPVFAYGRLSTVEVVGAADMAVWLILTLFLSVAGYYVVERPFRHKLDQRIVMLSLCGGLIAVTSVFFLGTRTEVLSAHRAAQLSEIYGGDFYDNEVLDAQTWDRLNALAEQTEGARGPNARRPSDDEIQRLWFEDPSALNILVIGNSHSRDMFNAMDIVAEQIPQIEVARFGMLTLFPDFQRAEMLATPNFAAADVVMIASRYNDQGLDAAMNALIDDLLDAGKTVVLVGNTAEFETPGQVPLFDYIARGGAELGPMDAINSIAFQAQNPRVDPLNQSLRQIAEARGVHYLSRRALLCSNEAQVCTLRLPGGGKTLYDYGHWTLSGAALIAERIVATDWLAPVLEAACEGRSDGPCAR